MKTTKDINYLRKKGCYDHFNQRLTERYGISVTMKEYEELCWTVIKIGKTVKRKGKGKEAGYGIVKIKRMEVIVLKELFDAGLLITALPNNIQNRYKYSLQHAKPKKEVKHE